MQRVTKTQLSSLGHFIRRNKDSLIQQYCIYEPANAQCRRDQQKTIYQQHTANTIYDNALVEEKVLQDVMGARIAWHRFVKADSHFSNSG